MKHPIIYAVILTILSSMAGLQASGENAPPPDPTRWENDILEFEKTYSAQKPDESPVLFVGSSSIKLWQNIESDFPGMPVIQRGFGGSLLTDILYYFDRLIANCQPRMVVLYAGENDIVRGASPETIAQNFQLFSTRMRENLPDVPVIFIAIKPSPARMHLFPQISSANKLIQDLCEANPQLIFADVASPMLLDNKTANPDLYVKDGIHMNAKGYAIWTQLLQDLLR